MINLKKMNENQVEQAEFKSRTEELVRKFLHGFITNEETKELIQKSLAFALESIEIIRRLEERLAKNEDTVELLDSANRVYQDFIYSKELNDEFTGFYEGLLDELIKEQEDSSVESDETDPENIVN